MDYSDLLAKIQVYFTILNFLEPTQPWGWHHPDLVKWMADNHVDSYRSLDEMHLRVILTALEKVYERLYDRHMSRRAAQLPEKATTHA